MNNIEIINFAIKALRKYPNDPDKFKQEMLNISSINEDELETFLKTPLKYLLGIKE